MKILIDDKGNKYFISKRGTEGKIYLPKLSWFAGKYKSGPWFTRSPYLRLLVQWLITLSVAYPKIFGNYGTFKKGDRCKYNWKAFVQIYQTGGKDFSLIRTVCEVNYSDQSGLVFTNGDSCDAYWVRKIYFWEK